MSIEFGFYPLTAILTGGLLWGLYRLLMRMHCQPRACQRFIAVAAVVTIAAAFVQPVRIVPAGEGSESGPESQAAGSAYKRSIGNEKAETAMAIGNGEAEKNSAEGKKAMAEDRQPVGWQLFTEEAAPLLWKVYLTGAAFMLLYLLAQLLWLWRFQIRHRRKEDDSESTVYSSAIPMPFSIGKRIYLPTSIDEEMRQDVMLHEQQHVRHHHFTKLCLMQAVLSFGWFNPFMWLFSREQKLQQEMEVDCDVVESGRDRERYQTNLLRMCLQGYRWVQVMPAFGSSVIKQRILFMNRSNRLPHAKRYAVAAAVSALVVVG